MQINELAPGLASDKSLIKSRKIGKERDMTDRFGLETAAFNCSKMAKDYLYAST